MSERKKIIVHTADFEEILLIVFIVLKLTGVIAWSWWWVLSPLWISLAIYLVTLPGALAVQPKRRV
jgi:uncharacterized protein (DUF983 family)